MESYLLNWIYTHAAVHAEQYREAQKKTKKSSKNNVNETNLARLQLQQGQGQHSKKQDRTEWIQTVGKLFKLQWWKHHWLKDQLICHT